MRAARFGTRRAHRLRGLLTLVGAVSLVWAGTTAATAQIGDIGNYTATGVRIRSGPSTDYAPLGLGYPGQEACLFYYRQDENGTPMRLWWNHVNMTTGVRGYSSDALIRTDYPLTECGLASPRSDRSADAVSEASSAVDPVTRR